MELSGTKTDYFLIFSNKGPFRAQNIKKTHSEKVSQILGNGTFLPQA